MKILFLDQSGKLGGAELCLLDIVREYRDRALVALFSDGPFREVLQQHQIPVEVLTHQPISVQKRSGLIQGLRSLNTLIPTIQQVTRLSRQFDVIYANTQKALVVGAIAGFLTRRPLVYHLHDILSVEHFSPTNLRLAVTLANHFASLIIANSYAAREAFVAVGGQADKVTVVYNGFNPEPYLQPAINSAQIRHQLGLEGRFIVGHFSRLSPWKGQHILLDALCYCPEDVVAVFVGDALFGEQDYVEQLHRQVKQQGLQQRVRFLGFRSNVPELMAMCDLVAHTSTAPEPFGRVIVEAMLCGTPVIAAADGAAIELVEPEKTGWLTPPKDPIALATLIKRCFEQRKEMKSIAHYAQQYAFNKFNLEITNHQIESLINEVIKTK